MIAIAVIERELRAVSRQSLTYALRVLGASAFIAILGIFWLAGHSAQGLGALLFSRFHRTLFLGIWFFVPLMTADCISRERREGTLPLLFLTTLNRRDVVYAKGLVHGLRSLTLWLAVVPVFTICFLAGGVGWLEVLISCLINLSSICLALGAAVVASSNLRGWNQSLAAAACFAWVLFCGFLCSLPFTFMIARSTGVLMRLPVDDSGAMIVNGFALAVNYDDLWQRCSASLGNSQKTLFWCFGAVTAISVFSLYWLLGLSAWNLQRSWRDNPASERVSRAKARLLKPVVFEKQLRGWLRWHLKRNPVGWLEQRSWSGRLVAWSWVAVVACVYSSLFGNIGIYEHSFRVFQSVMAVLLASSIAAASSNSFRRERETGVLELLLVSPLREWQIVTGRVRGIWAQFMPAAFLLLGLWLYTAAFAGVTNQLPFALSHAVTFATLPVVGLYFSLTKPTFISALVWTLGVQLVVPSIAIFVYSAQEDHGGESFWGLLWVGMGQVIVAGLLARRLWTRLSTRSFAQGAPLGS